jgi:hypothetical protein
MPYPDWVLKYKKPGMYVKKKDEHTYRLYRGHSERRADKPYPVLVTDEYIGTITKEQGLKRTKPNIKGEVLVKRYGGYCLLYNLNRARAEELTGSDEHAAVFLEACMLVLYGRSSDVLYRADWMSEQRSTLQFPLSGAAAREAARIAEGLETSLRSRFGTQKQAVLDAASSIYRVNINRMWVTSSTSLADWVTDVYGISWKGV